MAGKLSFRAQKALHILIDAQRHQHARPLVNLFVARTQAHVGERRAIDVTEGGDSGQRRQGRTLRLSPGTELDDGRQ